MLFVALVGVAGGAPARAAAAQPIDIDPAAPGRTYDGIGALSAGASSRLLIDYPEPQRSRILDYLFKPGYGANLQVLRVEIGGDTNSTAGAEASHMRNRNDLGCDRGYEWWLMREAKRRNPGIVLSGLQWGAPGWFEGGFWSRDNIDYLLAWLGCAKRHGLDIDYLGGWNESADFDAGWFVALKRALREHGEDAKVIAADGWGSDLATRWKVADEMWRNPDFRDAVDVLSVHYPCGSQYDGAPYDHCPSTPEAQALEKPLWAGEQGSQQYDIGAAPLAKAINRAYIDGRMTATVNWSLVASWYTTIPYAGAGLMRAYQPWSGYFEASRSLWAVAHTTQFAQPGWHYVDPASGYLDQGGSFATLRSPDGGDYSTVVETVDATAPQTVRLDARGNARQTPVHVWSTDLRSSQPADWFVDEGARDPVDGAVEVTLQPGRAYTLTTTTGQGRGTAGASPGSDALQRLPYREGFDHTNPPLLSDFNGRFEVEPCPGGRGGRCLAQQVTTPPIEWRYVTRTPPLTVLGDPNQPGDYRVSVLARLDRAPHVDLIGRADAVLLGAGAQPGYRLRVTRDGGWTLLEQAANGAERVLASGDARQPFDPRGWHRLGLAFAGDRIAASLDGRPVASVRDSRHNRGQVGLMVGDWATAEFDELRIAPTTEAEERIPQSLMRAVATSEHLGYDAGNAIDANSTSLWHTEWSPPAALPQSITLKLDRPRRVRTLHYTPRADGNGNGVITAYTIAASTDGTTFTKLAEGTWPLDARTKTATFDARGARAIRLEATQAGGGYASAAEIALSQERHDESTGG